MTHDNHRHPQALVVDNRRRLRHRIVAQLLPTYTVHTAESGEDAIETLLEHSYDIVIVREALPVMSGLALLTYLRTTLHNPLPTIVLLEKDPHQGLEALARLPACDWLISKEVATTTILPRAIAQLLVRTAMQGTIHDLERRLSDMTHIDPLTRVYNRTYLDQSILLEMARAQLNQEYLSMVMIDVDDFKLVNDSYGHLMGDLVLKEIAATMRAHTRPQDILCRYGGDEFLILFPRTAAEDALEICTRFKDDIESRCFGTLTSPVTISIGLIPLSAGIETVEMLLHEADRRLYLAKEQGKNCIYYN